MKADEYRTKALEFLELSERASEDSVKRGLLDLSLAYLRLAQLADKNAMTDLVYESPPRPSSPHIH
jgi:hypothetical protein